MERGKFYGLSVLLFYFCVDLALTQFSETFIYWGNYFQTCERVRHVCAYSKESKSSGGDNGGNIICDELN